MQPINRDAKIAYRETPFDTCVLTGMNCSDGDCRKCVFVLIHKLQR